MPRQGTNATHLASAARSAPYLERDEEHQLAVRWTTQRDQQALCQLTIAHMRLVIAMAGKFRNYGLAMNDLVQEGHVGLLEAAARFNPERGVRFSTYATWWIRASIQEFVLRNWSIVRPGTSSNQKSLFFNLRKIRRKIAQSGTPVSSQEMYQQIATAIGRPLSDVVAMDARLSSSDISLNAPVFDDSGNPGERQDFLPDDSALPDEVVEHTIDAARHNAWLKAAMTNLDEREARIISARRLSEEGATLEALGLELGVSKERVRQLENRAMQKLKVAMLAFTEDSALPA
ncbi:MAG: RNA polymerase factor sigma-32 [Rhizobiaceae bacterium]